MESKDAVLKQMGQNCSQVAHDMRSPLSCIFAGIAVLQSPDYNATDRAEMLQIMQTCAEKLNRMVEELLEYRRAHHIQKAPTDIAALVQGICSELCVQATKTGVQLELLGTECADLSVDTSKIERVVQNLVQNAIQAVSGCSPSQVTVSVAVEAERTVIRIRDTGPGLPQEYTHKLFKEGFTTKGKAGNGLGLPYCRAVVEAHGGTISAHNHPDGGAEFVVSLPMVD